MLIFLFPLIKNLFVFSNEVYIFLLFIFITMFFFSPDFPLSNIFLSIVSLFFHLSTVKEKIHYVKIFSFVENEAEYFPHFFFLLKSHLKISLCKVYIVFMCLFLIIVSYSNCQPTSSLFFFFFIIYVNKDRTCKIIHEFLFTFFEAQWWIFFSLLNLIIFYILIGFKSGELEED